MPTLKITLTLALAGTVLFAAGCGKKIPKDALEASIKTAYDKKGVSFKSVTCPGPRDVKAGDAFDCTAELADGGNATINVKQKDDKGSLTYEVAGIIVTAADISKALSTPEAKVDVTCPKKTAILRKGETVVCDLTAGADKGKVTAKASDDEKKIDLKTELAGKPPVEKEQAAADDEEEGAAPSE